MVHLKFSGCKLDKNVWYHDTAKLPFDGKYVVMLNTIHFHFVQNLPAITSTGELTRRNMNIVSKHELICELKCRQYAPRASCLPTVVHIHTPDHAAADWRADCKNHPQHTQYSVSIQCFLLSTDEISAQCNSNQQSKLHKRCCNVKLHDRKRTINVKKL